MQKIFTHPHLYSENDVNLKYDLKGTVGSSVSKGLYGKMSEVTSLKKFLQFETILRTLNTEFLSASEGTAPRPLLLGSPSASKKNPPSNTV